MAQDVRISRPVYGLEIKTSAVYLTAAEVQALDVLVGPDDTAHVTAEQTSAARSFIRQALGLTVGIERK